MPKKVISPEEATALHRCAVLVWQNRDALKLSMSDTEQTLIALMAVGTPQEGEAAAGIVNYLREAADRQLSLDAILGITPAK